MSTCSDEAQCIIPTCDVHNEEELDIYCYTCQKSICFDCIRKESTHASHNYERISKIIKLLHREVKTTLNEKTEKELSKLQSEVEVFKETEKFGNLMHDDTLARVDEQREKLHSVVDLVADKMIEIAEEGNEERQSNIKKFIEERENRIQELEGAFSFLQESLSNTSDHGLLQLKLDYEQKLSHHIEKIHIRHLSDSNTVFIEGEIIQTILGSMFGSFCECKPSQVNITKRGELEHGGDNISCIVPVSDDNCWYLPVNGIKMLLTDKNGSILSEQEFSTPCRGFDVIDDGEIFFTSCEAQAVKKIGLCDSECVVMDTNPLYPVGIKLTVDEDILVTLIDDFNFDPKEDSRRLVQKISTTGEVKRTYEFVGDGERLFTIPVKAIQNYNKDICVVDQTNLNTGRLCVLELDGKLKCIYNGQSQTNNFLPEDVACDRTCNIILNDVNNYVIHLLNPAGELVKYLSVDFSKATISLGMCKSSLWVGCNEGHIKIYKYQYNDDDQTCDPDHTYVNCVFLK